MTLRTLSFGLVLAGYSSGVSAQTASLPLNAPTATAQFYAGLEIKDVWASEANFSGLVLALEGLKAHGLNPDDYHLEELKQLSAPSERRDRLATDAWLSAAAHMLYGKLNPISVEPDWTAARREADLKSALQAALKKQSIRTSLDQFAPKQPSYAALKAEYATLINQAGQPQTTIPSGETLKTGMSGARAALLKTRLVELGYLVGPFTDTVLDASAIDAVKAFQANTDLNADGAVGPATLAALNRGLEGKLNQLRVNMERWRWLPDDLGKRHLRANIAGFNVTAWNEGVIESSHLTIVGRTYRKTPVFSDEIEYLDFNPWWETPNSLATRDKLPTFRKDPSAVERLGFQIRDRQGQIVPSSSIDWNAVGPGNFPYRIRQKPGELNALGQVKIMFPNVHNVYLHDTPTKGLFAQQQRAFSSGCLRTENPLALSAWILKDTPDWSRERIDTVVASGQETRARLAKTVPVHILYFTTVSQGEYGIRYLDDIYDRDGRVLRGLNEKPRPI